jgi:hypothetical protein
LPACLQLYAPKCKLCSEVIKDVGLHACGASWHKDCFVCTSCSAPFPDGAYHEVDGRPYCSAHYYELYGSKCAGCGEYITEELLNALGKTWHPTCFCCENCKSPFADMEFYDKAGKAYDETCYCELFCPVCPVCGCYVVEDGSAALGETYHPWCLCCSNCGEALTDTVHKTEDGKLYCEHDFLALVAKECAGCGYAIVDDSLTALGKSWHPSCFVCAYEGCGVQLTDAFHEVDDKPYCTTHYGVLKGEPCARCGIGIAPEEQLMVLKQAWHAHCLQCCMCSKTLTTADRIFPKTLKPDTLPQPTCETCFTASADKCPTCAKPILGKFLTVLGRKYHPENNCLSCAVCSAPFPDGKMFQREGWPVCGVHAKGPLEPDQAAKLKSGPPPAAPPPPPPPPAAK